ncbi:MAG: hypothetical protein CMJ78_09440 [Planctomycetaceae bacterium]|nr:hypothetical protein [Planctomycetaceae bacterium]
MRILLTLTLAFGLSGSSFAADVIGWRVNGSGRFPGATPLTEWSADKNIEWKAPLPGNRYASPVLVGDRIFVTSDPDDLFCISLADGSVLWQQKLSPVEVLGKEAAAEATAKFNDPVTRDKQIRNQYKKLEKDDRKREALVEESKKLKTQLNELKLRLPIGRARSSNACGTPLCDGERLFVTMGTGIVGAFKLDGTKLWSRFVEGCSLGFGHSNTAVLIDGKLIVNFRNLIALDAATGKELWRQEIRPRYASPVAVQIGGESILIHPSGLAIRSKDGTQAGKLGLNTSESTPVLNGNVLFAHSKGSLRAIRLPAELTDDAQFEQLWNVTSARDRRTPSRVYHNGLLYNTTTSGLMDVVHMETGEIAYRKRLGLKRVYSSLSVEGDYVFACSTDGTTVVFKTGPEYEEVTRNELESCGSCLVFNDNRLLMRARSHLYSIRSK